MISVLSWAWDKKKNSLWVPMRYRVLMGTQNFSLSHTRNEMKNIFLYICNKLKIYHLSSIQDLFHKNFIIDLAHRSLRGSVVEYRNSESKGLRSEVQFLMGTQHFFFVPCLWKDETFLYIFTEQQIYYLYYSIHKLGQRSQHLSLNPRNLIGNNQQMQWHIKILLP